MSEKTLESVFLVQHATLITHDHWDRKPIAEPYFHVWPLTRTYKTAEEPIKHWQTHCHTMNSDSCCSPGHHFMRIEQHPLNTPQSYYDYWKADDYMAQYSYLQDELRKEFQLDKDQYIFTKTYFGDDGKELLDPFTGFYIPSGLFNDKAAHQHRLQQRGDIGCHFRNWWLRQHGFVKDGSIIWPRGANPNEW